MYIYDYGSSSILTPLYSTWAKKKGTTIFAFVDSRSSATPKKKRWIFCNNFILNSTLWWLPSYYFAATIYARQGNEVTYLFYVMVKNINVYAWWLVQFIEIFMIVVVVCIKFFYRIRTFMIIVFTHQLENTYVLFSHQFVLIPYLVWMQITPVKM